MGYVRVSSKDQNTERQLKKMRELGIEERIFSLTSKAERILTVRNKKRR